MIKFDFTSMCNFNKELLDKKAEVLCKFNNSYMNGWTSPIDQDIINDVIKTSKEIKTHSSCMVVIGIGGSFLGSYCIEKALAPYFKDNNFKVIYAGTTLSSVYMEELLCYLETVDFSINVISKSGTTMETTITYKLIKELMEKKYSKEELRKRIVITTDKEHGALRQEVKEEGYKSFIIPDNIGGRYSIMTPAHLFPLAFNIDIEEFVRGYYDGYKYLDKAFLYAVCRKSMFDQGKVVENFVVYEEKLNYFSEWLKQLFGETEGKNGVGLLPTSTVHTRDLHSLGQMVQEGNKILFETFIKIENSSQVKFKDHDLHNINNVVLDSVRIAHKKGEVSSIMITLPELSEKYLGEVMYFFMLSAAFSGFLFGVDPFNQPGVEVYKKEVREKIVI